MELKLFEFVRCRTLYEKWIEWDSSNCSAWIKFAELERGLDDLERCRAISEIAVEQPVLDMPELLWKAYIDFGGGGRRVRAHAPALREVAGEDEPRQSLDLVRALRDQRPGTPTSQTTKRKKHPSATKPRARARAVFQRAHKIYKDKELKDERVALLNAWKSFEDTHGAEEDKEKIAKQMPRRVKKRRRLDDDSFEEYMDYVFPADDESSQKMSKLMAAAQKWKKEQEGDGA